LAQRFEKFHSLKSLPGSLISLIFSPDLSFVVGTLSQL